MTYTAGMTVTTSSGKAQDRPVPVTKALMPRVGPRRTRTETSVRNRNCSKAACSERNSHRDRDRRDSICHVKGSLGRSHGQISVD
jgi:hypothetical protein